MDQISFSLYVPLIIAGVLYGALYIAGSTMERGERLTDLSFVVALLAGAWVVVLLVISIGSEPEQFWDMLVIVFVVAVFFALLLLLLFAVLELIFSRGPRRARRTPEER